jgi:hypothetical protein
MAITQGTLGTGRIGLKKLFAIESDKVEKQYIDIVGRIDKTDQTAEVYKQYAGLGPATGTPEGNKVDYDDLVPLYVASFKPLMYSKGVKFSKQAAYTDQYNKLKSLTPDIARSFVQRRNLYTADLDNSGFTDTSRGMNTETLYSGSHLMGSYYGSNRPLAPGQSAGASPTTLDLAFGPLALEQAWSDIRRQKSARNLPMFPLGKLDIKVPPELYMQALRALRSLRLPGTNNNDDNVVREKFNAPVVIDYYTSTTAWFVKAADQNYHGLFFLEQMPYDIEELPPDDEIMRKWIAYESYIAGWYDWHGTYGTLGA